jgi:hypothetical protein
MADLYKKFSEAVKMISFAERSLQECVYCAYIDYLSDINSADLPEEIQIFYESVKIRLTSVVPPGDIGREEAVYLAKDILYMADVLKGHYKT